MNQPAIARPMVLVTLALPSTAANWLRQKFKVLVRTGAPALDPAMDSLTAAEAQSVRAVVSNGSIGLTRAQMTRLPQLEIVCAFGAGHENIDAAAARERGIVVAHAPGANDATVADHALGLMLALARGFIALDAATRRGEWAQARTERPTLHGSRLGIIGLGRIGAAIAARGEAFGMQVAYAARTVRTGVPWQHIPAVEALARESDFLVAACPGGAATRHLVNAAVLAALGKDGYFINIARGGVVDTAALAHALHHGIIAGAGLDVYENEPAISPALLAAPNTVFTPHVAGRSPASMAAQSRMLADNLAAHFDGRTPPHLVH